MNLAEIRDDLSDIIDLVDVCHFALLNRNCQDENSKRVANVLHFDVIKKLHLLDENLLEIRDPYD